MSCSTDIVVALTTSKHLIQTSLSEKEETELWRSNVPICVAEMGAFMSGTEDLFEEILLKMATSVVVDPVKKYVFIGIDPSNEETGLVVYTEKFNNECATEFFKRWVETHTLLFQFRMMFGTKTCFAMRGLWIGNKWEYLTRITKGYLDITPNVHDVSDGGESSHRDDSLQIID